MKMTMKMNMGTRMGMNVTRNEEEYEDEHGVKMKMNMLKVSIRAEVGEAQNAMKIGRKRGRLEPQLPKM